jgi:predicted ATPase with chaperone activity
MMTMRDGDAHDKVRRAARTIADLAGKELLTAMHPNKAIQYRRPHRSLSIRSAV